VASTAPISRATVVSWSRSDSSTPEARRPGCGTRYPCSHSGRRPRTTRAAARPATNAARATAAAVGGSEAVAATPKAAAPTVPISLSVAISVTAARCGRPAVARRRTRQRSPPRCPGVTRPSSSDSAPARRCQDIGRPLVETLYQRAGQRTYLPAVQTTRAAATGHGEKAGRRGKVTTGTATPTASEATATSRVTVAGRARPAPATCPLIPGRGRLLRGAPGRPPSAPTRRGPRPSLRARRPAGRR